MSSLHTRQRILDVAERMFAVKGVEGTSLREITRAADVNLAAVNYHFGSKEGLVREAFVRRVEPINRERIARLHDYLAETGAGPLSVERLLEAFFRPLFDSPRGAVHDDTLLLRLIGRLYADPSEALRQVYMQQVAEMVRQFCQAFQRALPELPREEVLWRMHFILGYMSHTLLASQVLRDFSGGLCDPSDHQQLLRRLVQFGAAGLRAPPPPSFTAAAFSLPARQGARLPAEVTA